MTYKTILVHVDQSANSRARMQLAAELAATHRAHLVGAAMTGVSRFAYTNGEVTQLDPELMDYLARFTNAVRIRAEEALDTFRGIADKADVRSWEATLFTDEPESGISLRARYSDLAVVSQFDPDDANSTVPPDFPEYVVLNAGRPVLVVPFAGEFSQIGKRPLIAWNGSTAATRAVSDALPLLRQATTVDVAIFNAHDSVDHGNQPGDDLALYLARHDLPVVVHNEATSLNMGISLLSLADDLDSDLIVMGGYGHSRFREILLGGATRTLLGAMTVPVLMSH
ncbi:universal stress protein [Noviherbaspirillum galbum]|uniref:Universal stress protein n=1 Tax=Noviherbaspirillum galbum TaxID=2709383 RepID=A0A6B3SNG7_9BURK|nr:universal stress protein [Noviherbaspirillum galbum]NEX62354.1 universal stress protein [Noviherbaspirillum galbum]